MAIGMPSHRRARKRSPVSLAKPGDSGEFPTAMAAAGAGEASSKLLRFLYFVGAVVICTKAIKRYGDYERKQEVSAAAAAAEAAAAKP